MNIVGHLAPDIAQRLGHESVTLHPSGSVRCPQPGGPSPCTRFRLCEALLGTLLRPNQHRLFNALPVKVKSGLTLSIPASFLSTYRNSETGFSLEHQRTYPALQVTV